MVLCNGAIALFILARKQIMPTLVRVVGKVQRIQLQGAPARPERFLGALP